MSHVNRKLEVVFERALDALIRELENKQWGKTERPRRSGGRKDRRPSRADKREVYERDRAGPENHDPGEWHVPLSPPHRTQAPTDV